MLAATFVKVRFFCPAPPNAVSISARAVAAAIVSEAAVYRALLVLSLDIPSIPTSILVNPAESFEKSTLLNVFVTPKTSNPVTFAPAPAAVKREVVLSGEFPPSRIKTSLVLEPPVITLVGSAMPLMVIISRPVDPTKV